jgi:hypothetical protein
MRALARVEALVAEMGTKAPSIRRKMRRIKTQSSQDFGTPLPENVSGIAAKNGCDLRVWSGAS